MIDLALESGLNVVEWDGGDKNKILWSEYDVMQENVNNSQVEYISPDEANERGLDYADELNRIEKASGIRVTGNKEAFILAFIDDKVVGAIYTETNSYEYSFDVIVDKPARGKGIGAKLIDYALADYSQLENDIGTELRVDVINPWVEKYLLKKGLKVLTKHGDHAIMTK